MPDAPEVARPVVGIVGAGTMGAGIAQLALTRDHDVVLHDVDAAAIERGVAHVRHGLGRRARLRIAPADAPAWIEAHLARLRTSTSLEDVAAADVVIEAALEDLEVKRSIFRRLDLAAAPDAVLATNTSALSVAEIAAATLRPERVLGLHFFNPAPVMPLVEVVAGPATAPAVAAAMAELVAGWEKTPVRSTDSPGFIVNRVNRPYTLEALAAFERGEAGIEAIDAVAAAAGFPMGPFAVMDLVGIDVNLAAARGVHEGFVRLGDPGAERFRPSPVQERLVAAGRLGRKTGAGFYEYDDESRSTGPAPEFAGSLGGGGAAEADAAAAVFERLRLAVDAEAVRAVAAGVATEADVDAAMRLGSAHPIGPFAHVASIGGADVLRARLAELAAAGFGLRFELADGG